MKSSVKALIVWCGVLPFFALAKYEWVLVDRIEPDGGVQEGSYFGPEMARDGNTLVVGAPLETANGVLEAGAAYVFVKENRKWIQQARLVLDPPSRYQRYGSRVTIHQDTIAIADHAISNGTTSGVYVFVRSDEEWILEQYLHPLSGGRDAIVSPLIALANDTLAVSEGDGWDSGFLSIYTRSQANWTLQSTFSTLLPLSLALQGGTLIVGEHFVYEYGEVAASAYVFERSDGNWSQSTRLLLPTDGRRLSNVDTTVDIDSGRIVVGEPLHDLDPWNRSSGFGIVHVFVRNGDGSWEQEESLVRTERARYFGGAVQIFQDKLVARGFDWPEPYNWTDRVFSFHRSDSGSWTEDIPIEPTLMTREIESPFEYTTLGRVFFYEALQLRGDELLIGAFELLDNSTTYDEYGVVLAFEATESSTNQELTLSPTEESPLFPTETPASHAPRENSTPQPTGEQIKTTSSGFFCAAMSVDHNSMVGAVGFYFFLVRLIEV